MATQHRQQPSRLFIPPGMNNQFGNLDTRSMFSPAIQTAAQPNFPHHGQPFNPMFGIQTPMQTSFFPHPSQPQRPMHPGHRPSQSVQFNGLGMHPPVPMTPLGQQFPPQMLHHGGGPLNINQPQPFIPKSRRTPSMIGGPPKAVLGGPNRKVSPLPPPAALALEEKLKAKKIVVKIPKEGDVTDDEVDENKSLWSRKPLPFSELPDLPPECLPEAQSAEIFPEETYRRNLPATVDVFLPTKLAWDTMRQREIDQKLEKLGIEPRSDQAVPEIHAPHARSASISSPADPALLLLKLNRLHQQQSGSLSTSPQLTASPGSQLAARFQGHSQSMSLAHSPTHQAWPRDQNEGINLNVEQDGIRGNRSPGGLYAPQGRVPAQLAVPPTVSRPESRPDFARGFGLDIPEEEEEQEEEEMEEQEEEQAEDADSEDNDQNIEEDVEEDDKENDDELDAEQSGEEDNLPDNDANRSITDDANVTGHTQAGVHTRHTSRISVALSVGSVSKPIEEGVASHSRNASVQMGFKAGETAVDSHVEEEVEIVDPLNEWTGSEDVRSVTDDLDDQESIGEWSNPSDEERARYARLQTRYIRRLERQGLEAQELPRRIPAFPVPPATHVAPEAEIEDDIISNPSDEGQHSLTLADLNAGTEKNEFLSLNARNGGSRPLPPLPHSREPSNQYSYYGSLPSHSREPSSDRLGTNSAPNASTTNQTHSRTPSIPSGPKKELNPFAKPFVFGAKPSPLTAAVPISVPASVHSEAASSPAQASAPSHSRLPSLGTSHVLNASAREFKPSGFTFKAPEGVPKLSFSESALATNETRPQAVAPLTRASQGREKRQRTSLSPEGTETDESEYEGDSMVSFKFPRAPEPTTVFNKSAPASISPAANRLAEHLEAAANAMDKPATFSRLSGAMPPVLPPLLGQESRSLTDTINATDFLSIDATRGSVLNDDPNSSVMQMPATQKQKRAPIPLDFKHPVSTNMVPAGLFKNLANGDGEDRLRSARGQGHTIDFSDALSDNSLDDLAMPAISRKVNNRMPKPEDLDVSHDDYDDASSEGEEEARSTHSSIGIPESPSTQESIVPPNITAYSKGLRLIERVESLLDQKMEILKDEILSQAPSLGKFVSSDTDELVREAMAMFRSQLRDSASKGFEDSTMDARGELDFEMIRSIVEQGHEEARRAIQEDLASILQNLRDSAGSTSPESILDLVRGMQELKANVLATSAHLSKRLDIMDSTSPQGRESLVIDVLSALRPQLAAIRSEPIDYDGLTAQLSQAVKPHITQLIDLASDKRETADLIAERLMPILQSIASAQAPIDTGSLISELTVTINRLIAPIDSHNIKEQVADLVVERLNSRLSVRDNDIATGLDGLKKDFAELLKPLTTQSGTIDEQLTAFVGQHEQSSSKTLDALTEQSSALRNLPNILEHVENVGKTAASIQSALTEQLSSSKTNTDRIEDLIKAAVDTRPALSSETEEALHETRRLLAALNPLPDSVQGALSTYEQKQAEILSQIKSDQDSAQEIRRLSAANAELHSQLSKARSQHGQVRVEKENLNQKVVSVQEERDRLQAKVAEFGLAEMDHVMEQKALEARNAEQERFTQDALDRLKTSEANAQTQLERISALEKANRDLTLETHMLKSKINGFEMKAEFDARDKESVQQTLRLVQADRDQLASQQSHWEEMRRTAEQVDMLTALMSKAESDELAELKRQRDVAVKLEAEHAALKQRYKEQSGKFATLERTAAIARENIGQAQARAGEWEKKAREFEGEVERLSTVVEQGEQTRSQLDADYQLAKIQLDEVDAEKRLAKDRERKLEEEIASLKTQLSEAKSELEEERKVSHAAAAAAAVASTTNVRPSSRASTICDAAEPTTPRMNGKSVPVSRSRSPITSTWDSMHAPKRPGYVKSALRGRQPVTNYKVRGASPAPSVASLAPTQGEDGWWS